MSGPPYELLTEDWLVHYASWLVLRAVFWGMLLACGVWLHNKFLGAIWALSDGGK